MPQLNPSTYISQIFWLLVNFLLLLTIMRFVIVPRIKGIIEERRKNIEGYIRKAEKLQEEALLSLEKYNKAIDKAKKTAEDINLSAGTEIEKFIKEKTEQTSAELNAKILESEKILQQEKIAAINEAKAKAEEVSFVLIKKIGLSNINEEDVRQFISGYSEENNG